jgi:protein-disulfide isomerase
VTIVFFTDLECPYCSRAASTLDALERRYGADRLRIVVKHNPLPFHRAARRAAEVTQAVRDLGGSKKAFEFMTLAYVAQEQLATEPYVAWLKQLGIDPKAVLERVSSPALAASIDRDMKLALSLGANATPSFRINGRTLEGALPLEAFSEIIDEELAAARSTAESGIATNEIYAQRVLLNGSVRAGPAPEPPALPEEMAVYKVPLEGAPLQGPPDAPVTIVAFVDYECPFSKRVKPTLDALLQSYPSDVRLAVRQNPLSFHPRALPAARLALEARAQQGDSGFFAANARLLDSSSLDEPALLAIARELRLDDKRVRSALSSDRHDKTVHRDQLVAARFRATGTPHFFVNGVRLSGAQPLATFRTLVDDRLEAAQAMVANGVRRGDVYAEILKVATDAEEPEHKEVGPPPADAPSRGPRNARLVVQTFTDLQCPFCARGHAVLEELERRHPGKLRIVFRHLPLPMHEHARPAARVALRARQLGGDTAFWRVVDALYHGQGDADAFSDAQFRRCAIAAGVSAEELASAASDASLDAAIDRDLAAAEAAEIRSTPIFSINGYIVRGAQPIAAFENVLDHAERAATRRP